jgi:hypothetical protein
MTEPPNDLLKGSRAIADELGVSQQQVLGMVHRSELPAFIRGNALMIRRVTLHRWQHAVSLSNDAKALMAEANAIMESARHEAELFESIDQA